MKKTVLVVAALLFLSGCATKDPRVVAFEAGKRAVEVDKRVLMECEDLPKLKGPKDADSVAATEAWMNQYQECRAWKKELNRIVKDAFNTGK